MIANIYSIEELETYYIGKAKTGTSSYTATDCEEIDDRELYLLREDMPDFADGIIDIKTNPIIRRYKAIVDTVKKEFGYRCQICSFSFTADNNRDYCEAHHLVPLSKSGTQHPENVIILCPNHHRLFHYASGSVEIGEVVGANRTIKIYDEVFIVPVSVLN